MILSDISRYCEGAHSLRSAQVALIPFPCFSMSCICRLIKRSKRTNIFLLLHVQVSLFTLFTFFSLFILVCKHMANEFFKGGFFNSFYLKQVCIFLFLFRPLMTIHRAHSLPFRGSFIPFQFNPLRRTILPSLG